jgi:hypothetical protein
MPRRAPDPIKMAILGGDLLVSRSLERQLQSVGYAACFLNGSLNGSFTEELDELLEQVRLVIFTPRMSTERRNAFLSIVRGTPATAKMPVLELVTASDTSQNGREELVALVLWPCHIEEFKRVVEAALLNGAAPQ